MKSSESINFQRWLNTSFHLSNSPRCDRIKNTLKDFRTRTRNLFPPILPITSRRKQRRSPDHHFQEKDTLVFAMISYLLASVRSTGWLFVVFILFLDQSIRLETVYSVLFRTCIVVPFFASKRSRNEVIFVPTYSKRIRLIDLPSERSRFLFYVLNIVGHHVQSKPISPKFIFLP